MRSIIQTIIQVVVAIAVVVIGVNVARNLAGGKPPLPKSTQQEEVTVFTKSVQNGEVAVKVSATGALLALERVDLFSEVQGVMLPDGGRFKAGNSFGSGQSLIGINNADFEASLRSQRSNLQSLITSALADLRLDHPESFETWKTYLDNLDVSMNIAELPETRSEKEQLFIVGRNILSTYYQIKNSEAIAGKYRISAPFNGVLTEALVTPGTVIRPGQKLGSFIKPGIYEMETPINSAMVDQLNVGQKVMVNATDNSNRSWVGEVVRINRTVDASTQTMNAYIRLAANDLEEGMYLQGDISATSIPNAFELPREVLFEQDQLFIERNGELVQTTVEPMYFTEKSVVVRGLENGSSVLVKMPPSAYPGMVVKPVSDSSEDRVEQVAGNSSENDDSN